MDIHTRLCADDPVASSDLAIAYLEPLAAWLRRTNPSLDPHLGDQAAEDAILSLIGKPRSFDPAKSPLDVYLRMSAKGDLRNALERERRHSSRRADLADVELRGAVGNLMQVERDPARIVEQESEWRDAREQSIPTAVEQALTPEERRVLSLMLDRERRTEVYARALGISAQPDGEQRQAVKRIKDRIKRRIKRARGGT